jgi:uncharacterized protein
MILSRYLKIFPSGNRQGDSLFYSTGKTSLAVLPQGKCREIETGSLSASDLRLLTELGVLAADPESENQSMAGYLQTLAESQSELAVMAVMNLDCNFSCRYCYEGDLKGKLYMDPSTADGMVAFIRKRFRPHKKKITVDFYGGEPLLSLPLIRSVSGSLKRFAQDNGASFRFTLVTNGSLFSRKVAEELVSLGLTSVKITIDGPAEIHDRNRPFRSGAGSFDRLIQNIRETWDLIKVGIGGNYERDNYRQFVRLLDFLMDSGLTPEKLFYIKFDPVSAVPRENRTAADFSDGCMSADAPWLLDASLWLREEILKRGFFTPKIRPFFCMVENPDSFVVHYNGDLYKCPGFIGTERYRVGNIHSGMAGDISPYRPGLWKNAECMACAYLPICFGGCRYMTYLQRGRIDTVDCKKIYFDAVLEALIRQDIRYRRP